MGMFRLAFVPPDFKVPETVDTEKFHLHPLRLQDALEDYRAIMDDYPDHVRNFRKDPDLSREHIYSIYMNMRELGWHEVEFLRRSSFTYVIRGKDPNKPSYRGCIYVYPCAKVDYDVEIYLWVTRVQPDDGLEAHVIEWTREWIIEQWPFSKPLIVYHEVGWDDYEKLPDGRTFAGQHWW